MTDTKKQIMDAAEKCFARDGIAKASIRTIIAEAGVNLGAVTYHFGSKDNLVIAVYKRRIVPISEAQLKRISELESNNGENTLTLHRLIEALVTPFRKEVERHPEFLPFMKQLSNYPSAKFHEAIKNESQNFMARIDDALRRVLPDMSKEEREIKKHLLFINIFIAMENQSRLARHFEKWPGTDRFVTVLIAFLEGGIASAVTSPDESDSGRQEQAPSF
ncbi:MAG: TetR/AcrR family transcriptional regulator [Deltaproteobacteria bacterium]|nr:TetR/AcrR family transcriptional regulator [Deltaproteobacteria bacterium]